MMNELFESRTTKEAVAMEDTVVLDLDRYTALVAKEVELSILEQVLMSPTSFMAQDVLKRIKAARADRIIRGGEEVHKL